MMENYMVLDKWWTESVDTRKAVGKCIYCKQTQHEENEIYESDDFVETDDGIVCLDCWGEHFKKLRRAQGR